MRDVTKQRYILEIFVTIYFTNFYLCNKFVLLRTNKSFIQPESFLFNQHLLHTLQHFQQLHTLHFQEYLVKLLFGIHFFPFLSLIFEKLGVLNTSVIFKHVVDHNFVWCTQFVVSWSCHMTQEQPTFLCSHYCYRVLILFCARLVAYVIFSRNVRLERYKCATGISCPPRQETIYLVVCVL